MNDAKTLYQQVVSITYEYLGPAADRFVMRQVRNHLQKAPEALERKDLAQLIVWIQLAMNLLSEDRRLVEAYIANLTTLSQPSKQQSKRGRAVTR